MKLQQKDTTDLGMMLKIRADEKEELKDRDEASSGNCPTSESPGFEAISHHRPTGAFPPGAGASLRNSTRVKRGVRSERRSGTRLE